MARHWFANSYVFCDTNGVAHSRTLITSIRISYDLQLGRLNEPLPQSVKISKVLPPNYADYIGSGRYLPTICMNQEKAATVLEVADLNCETTDNGGNHYFEYGSLLPDNYVSSDRHNVRAATSGGNSGSPVFLVADGELVFLFSKHLGFNDNLTWTYSYGPAVTPRLTLIQNQINAWEGENAILYQVETLDLDSFEAIVNH